MTPPLAEPFAVAGENIRLEPELRLLGELLGEPARPLPAAEITRLLRWAHRVDVDAAALALVRAGAVAVRWPAGARCPRFWPIPAVEGEGEAA